MFTVSSSVSPEIVVKHLITGINSYEEQDVDLKGNELDSGRAFVGANTKPVLTFEEALLEAKELLKNRLIIGSDEESSLFVDLLLETDIPVRLVSILSHLDSDKIALRVVGLFEYLLKLRASSAIKSYFRENSQKIVIGLAVNIGKENKQVDTASCGILSSCVSNKDLWRECFANDFFVLRNILEKQLNVSPDDFLPESFRVLSKLLTVRRNLFADFLKDHHDAFFENYNKLLMAKNIYVVSHSLRLLSHVLLDSANNESMIRYINDKENLLLVIYLMRETRPSIILEAFHLLKIFVVNPNKSGQIINILAENRRGLVHVLSSFSNNEQNFNRECNLVIHILLQMVVTRLPSQEPIVTERRLIEVEHILFGKHGKEPCEEEALVLCRLMIAGDIPARILESLTTLTSIRARNSAARVMSHLLTWRHETIRPLIKCYLHKNATTLVRLLTVYCPENGLAEIYKKMMKDLIRHKCISEQCLSMEYLNSLYKYIQGPTALERENAFDTLKEILTVYKKKVSVFLLSKFKEFFSMYHKMMRSNHYDLQSKSISLLSRLLLEKENFLVMVQYVNSRRHLKLSLELLCVGCTDMRMEAFHVFKIFVANPNKPDQVKQYLSENRDSLLSYLDQFATEEQKNNEAFISEREFVKQVLMSFPQLVKIRDNSSPGVIRSCSSTTTTNSSNSRNSARMVA